MDVKGNLDNNVASRNYRSAEAPDTYVYVFSRELGYLPSIRSSFTYRRERVRTAVLELSDSNRDGLAMMPTYVMGICGSPIFLPLPRRQRFIGQVDDCAPMWSRSVIMSPTVIL
jgi:hypothetical protein